MTTTARTVSVTEAQLNRCHRIESNEGVFYLVESASEASREYKVTALHINGEFHLTCMIFGTDEPCPAEAHGRTCWHKRAALAAAAEHKAAMKQQAQAEVAESCRHCGCLCRGGICPRCAGA